ncbi:MAG: sulfatase-like hydrolase/transferase [Myxococcota bacterium]
MFQKNGFVTGGIVANVHLQPRFEFDEGFDDWWYDGQAKADAQVDRALAFLERYPDRDTFLFLHLMDPHLFYNAPPAFKDMYAEGDDDGLPDTFTRWDVYGWMKTGRMDEPRMKHIVARYDGELRFMSQELGRLFRSLDRMPGRSLVVVHSDHGEEFWEHRGFEHNHTVYDETTRALLWFRSGPGQANGVVNHTPVTLADIGPTLYELAGFADTPPTDGKSLAPLLLGTDDGAGWENREIGVAHLRYGKERWGVVYQGKKYILHTASGEEELFDLAADPGETKNVSPSTPLEPFRTALATAHGMEVSRGWRIRVDLPGNVGVPFSFALPVAAASAGVIDPEATIENPSNQAWGEPPHRTPEDIGMVTLSDDRKTLVYTPGPKPADGLLFVTFGADVDPGPTVIRRNDTPLVTIASRAKLSWTAGSEKIEIVPGTVVVPPIGEGPRIRAMMGGDQDLAGQRQQLCDLGYLDCTGDGDERPPDEHHSPE